MPLGIEGRLAALEGRWHPRRRFVPAAVRLRVYERGDTMDGVPTDRVSRVFGGVWDRHARTVLQDGTVLHGRMLPPEDDTPIVERPVSAPQMLYCEDYTQRLMGKGGRGGGKSEALAQKAECCLLDIAAGRLTRPGCDIVTLSPDYPHTRIVWSKILRRIERWILPRGIRTADREMRTIFGSSLLFKSAHDPDSIRGFEGAVGLLDEEKDICAEAYDNFLLCIRQALTPHIAGVGTPEAGGEYEARWEAMLDDERAARHSFPSRSNPFISHEIFDLAKSAMDEQRYRQEVLAEFVAMAIDEYVWRNEFDKERHGLPGVPDWRDITRAVTKKKPGRPYKYIAGVDYNEDYPNVAHIYRVFEPDGKRRPRRWVVVDVVRASGHASWLAQSMVNAGYTGHNTIVIDDASGEYNAIRQGKKANSSARLMRTMGFQCIHPKKNPPVKDRVYAFLAKLKPVEGAESWYYDASNEDVRKYVEACAMKQRWKNQKLDKADGVDHDFDALTYPIAYYEPAAPLAIAKPRAA